jgi:hypothetical protein
MQQFKDTTIDVAKLGSSYVLICIAYSRAQQKYVLFTYIYLRAHRAAADNTSFSLLVSLSTMPNKKGKRKAKAAAKKSFSIDRRAQKSIARSRLDAIISRMKKRREWCFAAT